jgi:hypothetical protein
VVEAQHIISTRRLVDSDAEHELLEELIEASKPALPRGREFEGLHFLLLTPFRYPPLRHGSRFATRHERGIWYGSERVETALAEAAYYRLLLLEGTAAKLAPLTAELSLFQARVAAGRGADLTVGPFLEFRAAISSPTTYAASQQLGRDLRADDVEAFRYFSARDPHGGTNVGVLAPSGFARKTPSAQQTWFCTVTREAVEFTKKDLVQPRRVAFARAAFLVDGRLPEPAL